MFCLSALTWKYKAVEQMGWEKMAHENEGEFYGNAAFIEKPSAQQNRLQEILDRP